jgi:hypothetical protein
MYIGKINLSFPSCLYYILWLRYVSNKTENICSIKTGCKTLQTWCLLTDVCGALAPEK